MSNFDISTLLNFESPKFECVNCSHLFFETQVRGHSFDEEWLTCPICKKHHSSPDGLRSIEFKDIFEHSRKLAAIGSEMYKSMRQSKIPPLRILLSAFLVAESFVHITTYGMNSEFLGALKLLAQGIEVRGIISNAGDRIQDEVKNYSDEHPNLDLITIPAKKNFRDPNDPTLHQKLVIIDGLLAFTGSTNLTFAGWRSAGKRRDLVDVSTNIGKIQELHNIYFCEHWLELNPSSEKCEDEIPF